jgi:hypothetical protein
VIQSAVASNASFVDTHFRSGGITIEHDGDPPEPADLRDLLCFLLVSEGSSANRSLRDLAIGVNTSLARGASWVEVSTRTSEGWVNQRWVSREETSHGDPKPVSAKGNVRFELRRTLSQSASEVLRWANKDIGSLLQRSRDVLDEDARAVHDRCRHAPVTVRINGRPIPPSTLGHPVKRNWSPTKVVAHRKPNLVEIALQASEESPHLISAPTSSHVNHRFVMQGIFDGTNFNTSGRLQRAPDQLPPRRCFAVIGLRANVPGEITVIKDGVDLTRLTPRSIPKGASILLTAEGLRLDMSQFRIVDSVETFERLSWLEHTVGRCAVSLLDLQDLHLTDEQVLHLKKLSEFAP